jgi:hypothetical protein
MSNILCIGCRSKPDKTTCKEFTITTIFIDSVSGHDLTGDSVALPFARYNKDSIRYMILSVFDTTDMLHPIITKVGLANNYTINYHFADNYQTNFGEYKIIYYLNTIDRDSITVKVLNNNQDNINVYKVNNLLGTLGDECQYNVTIKK